MIKKYPGILAKTIPLHETIYWLVFFLTVFGLLMSFSTTSTSYFTVGSTSPLRDFIKQSLFAVLGLILIHILQRLPMKLWKNGALPYYLISCFLLILVLIPRFYVPGIYNESGEATRRWLNLGFFSFQPSELAKLGVILLVARIMAHRKGKIDFQGFLKILLMIIIPAALIFLGPNFSTASIVLLLGVCTMVIGGTPIRHFVITAIPLVSGGLVLFLRSERLMSRIFSFQNVFQDPTNTGYQVLQSYIAIARGSWFGQGLQRSSQKFYSLPEAQNDFIFSVVCEEFGLFVAFFVVFLYLLLLFLAIRISIKARDSFSAIVSAMIGLHLFLQAMLHVGVTVGLFPPTGIPLPMVSIGGTALVIYLVEAGILIRIAKETQES